MRAREMAEEYPVTSLDSDAFEAARSLATHRMPGLVVTDRNGRPHSVLGASQVVRFLVPRYVQDDPSLAGVVDEQFADRVADKLTGRTVRDLLPDDPIELAVADADDTVVEVAAVMARTRCPLVAVIDHDKNIVGVITASRLLQRALGC
ncbi:CBS domain-containing protein [Actinocrispum sp. NPDC049592]|uniref:CBS domain-containing protein n=1 Tax=Actinocrispum sp. NPDC049592 TaxID=3154835 RepID=UPI00343A9499